jgi:hypothetical protein
MMEVPSAHPQHIHDAKHLVHTQLRIDVRAIPYVDMEPQPLYDNVRYTFLVLDVCRLRELDERFLPYI